MTSQLSPERDQVETNVVDQVVQMEQGACEQKFKAKSRPRAVGEKVGKQNPVKLGKR